AVYIDENGRERRQRASAVILCANGVGTPRLLLLSKSARFPDGLANSSGMVGKRLMMHPFSAVLGVYEDPLDGWQGPFGQMIDSFQFYETDE
ncbi:choline dehydrogenase, partial [Klebsiella pneumoniae]